MRIGLIGVGQAGGKIVDEFLSYQERTSGNFIRGVLAVNTASQDLQGLDLVPKDRRLLIGQDEVKGNGVGADNEKGAEVAKMDLGEIMSAIDSMPSHEIDAFVIVGALGGGTGSGGLPVIASKMKEIYTEPVYGLGILPSKDEGSIYTLNAARSFKTAVDEVDNLMLFDNDSWSQSEDSLQEWYKEVNNELVTRFGVLFSSGEVGEGEQVGESVVDSSEIINTLESGGISTIGYASNQLTEEEMGGTGLLSKFTKSSDDIDTSESTNRITSLVRKATLGRLTLPCEVSSTERALVVIAGRPKFLNRKGIERGRKWLESETGSMEVRGGDYPIDGSKYVSSVVLLSGVSDIPRIKELQSVAVEADERIEELRDKHDKNLEELVDDQEDVEPLF